MEVYTKLIRRLILGHAHTIFPWFVRTDGRNDGRAFEGASNFRFLVEEVQKASEDTDWARKVAEAIGGSDSDVFKDFELNAFMRHFNLDALGRSVFALG